VRRAFWIFLLVLLAGLGIQWAWSRLQSGSSALPALVRANQAKTLLFHVGTEPRTLDPQINQGIPESKILNCLFEGLVIDDPRDNAKQLPGVTEGWEQNQDLSAWTFHLRRNARWSNGDPVTAADFVFAFQRELTPELAAPFSDWYTRTYLLDPSVKNWYATILDSHPVKFLDLEAPETGMAR
jgi:oligopeptide transport system substrate-binding protein